MYFNHFPRMEGLQIPCKHPVNSRYECSDINRAAIQAVRNNFYEIPDKLIQDKKISDMIVVKSQRDTGKETMHVEEIH